MNQDLQLHLEKLKLELSNLEPAVKHLQRAEHNSTILINLLTNIHTQYSTHLKNIEASLSKANENHHRSLTKEIKDSTKNLNEIATSFESLSKIFENDIEKLLNQYKNLYSWSENLMNKIYAVEFPTRLDNIESKANSINQRLAESNKKNEIQKLEMNQKIALVSEENKTLKILVIISIGLTVASILLRIVSGT